MYRCSTALLLLLLSVSKCNYPPKELITAFHYNLYTPISCYHFTSRPPCACPSVSLTTASLFPCPPVIRQSLALNFWLDDLSFQFLLSLWSIFPSIPSPTSFDFVFDLLSSSTNPCLALLAIRDSPALFTPTSPLLIDISNFTDFVPLLLLTFFCSQTPLLNSQLAVSPSCHYICFSSLASFCFDNTDHWLDFITFHKPSL